MRDFIKKSLADVLRSAVRGIMEFEYRFKRENGDVISIVGSVVKQGRGFLADFRINRVRENGHSCSAIPVFGMPLNQKMIAYIAELAVENL